MSLENSQEEYDPVVALRAWRFDYSDEIPKEILRGSGQGKKYKVSKTSWTIPVGCLSLFVSSGQLEGELEEEVKKFIEKFSSEPFHQRLVAADDIEEANSLVDRVLQAVK